MNRPMWNRLEDPNLLLRYVETGTAATLLPSLPARSAGVGPGPLERIRLVHAAFVGRGVRYADEPASGHDGWQEIRGPAEVLKTARLANCVDLSVVFAGACLDSGVHPLIVLLEPMAGGPAHALVVVWTAGTWTGPGGAAEYREFMPGTDGAWPRGLREEPDGHGAFLPIDVARVTDAGASFDDAVRTGAELLASDSFRVFATLDVGLRYRKQGEFRAEPRRLKGIQTHSEEVAGLRDLQQNLLEDNLPFVPPTDPHAPTAPRALMDRLARDGGAPGVLLVGAAGVGKTRTCFEVAAQAVEDGWAVMHVTAGEAAVTNADLYDAIVTEHADRILIVLDYLNAYAQRLDLVSLRHQVLADAAQHNTKIAFIASCRPGWYATTDAPLGLLFEAVELEPDEAQTTVIRDRILKRIAPAATRDFGLAEMRKLTGDRPVIAMLIASEAERLHELGELVPALPGLRPADLLSWLERRLAEDDLLPEKSRKLFSDGDTEPSRNLQTCVAILLATPQPEADLLACGEEVKNADVVLRQLRAMKWLVATPVGIVPAHDLVTDQLVERILIQQPGAVVHAAAADRVLNAGRVAARTVGRYAMNLSRIIRDMKPAEASALREHCATWISGNSVVVGEVLAQNEDEGAYAIGAVLENPAWSPVAFGAWTELVEPWLRKHTRSIAARHLLYKGLRSDRSSADEHLVPESLAWLGDHGTTVEAGFVLGPLLKREIDGPARAEVVGFSLVWLGDHGTTVEAVFVLGPLLKCELDGVERVAADEFCLAWLRIHGARVEAQFVLGWLLEDDLDTAAADEAVGFGFRWLDAHAARQDAGSVLEALLRCELGGAEKEKAVRFGFAWLEKYGALVGAQHVLDVFLRCDFAVAEKEKAVGLGLAWLRIHGARVEAQFVLGSLLERELGAAADEVVEIGLTWLGSYRDLADAEFVLGSLLRSERAEEHVEAVIDMALAWLGSYGREPRSQFILGRLLVRPLDASRREVVVDFALEWIAANGVGSDLVSKYVGRQGAMIEPVAAAFVEWASKNPDDEDVVWRLTPVATKLPAWPHLAAPLLHAAEQAVWRLREEPAHEVNSRAEVDCLFEQLCRCLALRCGIPGARLDDLLFLWMDHPASLNPRCPPKFEFLALVSRVTSGLVVPGVRRDGSHGLLDRLEEWIAHWRFDSEKRDEAHLLVARARVYSAGWGGRGRPPHP